MIIIQKFYDLYIMKSWQEESLSNKGQLPPSQLSLNCPPCTMWHNSQCTMLHIDPDPLRTYSRLTNIPLSILPLPTHTNDRLAYTELQIGVHILFNVLLHIPFKVLCTFYFLIQSKLALSVAIIADQQQPFHWPWPWCFP